MKRSDLTRRLLLMPLAIVFFYPGVLVTQASATMITFESIMSGSQETPPTGSPATGQALVTLDTALQTLHVDVTFTGLSRRSCDAIARPLLCPAGDRRHRGGPVHELSQHDIRNVHQYI
jgi:CHRD domain-containing protein